MSIIQIRKAERKGARLVVGIAGVSGSGKTFTALQLAYGLAGGDGNKVGFLDTENQRGSLYASEATYKQVAASLGMKTLPGAFNIGDLYAPFTPQRYKQAIEEFQACVHLAPQCPPDEDDGKELGGGFSVWRQVA